MEKESDPGQNGSLKKRGQVLVVYFFFVGCIPCRLCFNWSSSMSHFIMILHIWPPSGETAYFSMRSLPFSCRKQECSHNHTFPEQIDRKSGERSQDHSSLPFIFAISVLSFFAILPSHFGVPICAFELPLGYDVLALAILLLLRPAYFCSALHCCRAAQFGHSLTFACRRSCRFASNILILQSG